MRHSKVSGRSRRPWRIAALAIIFISGTAAEAKPAEQISELMKLSSIDMFFDRFGDNMTAAMQQALPDSPLGAAYTDKVLAGLEAAAAKAFAPETLKREFQLALDGKVKEADLDSVLAFYKSPLGARMKVLEKASQAAAARAGIAKMTGELLERLKSEPERAEILALIDSAMRLTELSTGSAFNKERAMAIGLAATDAKTTALSSEALGAIDSVMQSKRSAMTAAIKAKILLFMAYTYREAAISELREYLAFVTSPAAKSYYGAVEPAMNEVLAKAGETFGHALMRELGKEHA